MADAGQEIELQTRAAKDAISNGASSSTNPVEIPKTKHYRWWLRVSVYIIFLLAGQATATLLGGLYYDKGGNSKWMATFAQSAGFPILIPVLLFVPPSIKSTSVPPISTILLLYLFFGLLLTGDNLMYSYGLLYLPVSTYSLLCATQLAFNALFSFLFNTQKFTSLIIKCLFLLTLSASLIAVTQISNGPIGSFHDKMEAPLDPTKELSRLVYEHKYEEAFTAALQRSHVWIVSWLCSQVDLQGLLTSNPLPLSQGVLLSLLQQLACDIGNDTSKKLAWMMDVVVAIKPSDNMIAMHVRPIFEQFKSILNHQVSIPTIVFFGDKMDGVKTIALLLAISGSVSYVYQHYLDDRNLKTKARSLVTGDISDKD